MRLTLSSKNAASVESYETIAPSRTNPSPNAVNDHGVIVGTVYGLNAPPIDGFLLDKGAITHITYPGANWTTADGINNAGTVAGVYTVDNDVTEHVFTYAKGKFKPVPDYPGATDTFAWSINTNGDMSGYEDDASGTHGFLLQNGVYTQLDPPGSVYTIAVGLNDSDQVVGIYCLDAAACNENDDVIHGFLYSHGTYATIDVPGLTSTEPSGINNAGVILASYTETNEFTHGVLITQ